MKDTAICLFLYANRTMRFNMNTINNLLKSLYKYSFTVDNKPQFVLLTNMDTIKSQDDSMVVLIDESPYKLNQIELRKFKLDIFKLKQFKRVVYIDTDILFCKDVSELWDLNQFNDADIYGRAESAVYSDYPAPDNAINSGLLILNERALDGKMFNGLMDITNADNLSYLGGDQEVINDYLGKHPEFKVGFLPLMYNTFVWNIDKLIPASEVKGVHFVGSVKPWQISEIDLTARHVYYNILGKVENK